MSIDNENQKDEIVISKNEQNQELKGQNINKNQSQEKQSQEVESDTEILDREGDKPALIEYYENGRIRKETYYKENKIHREGDKPAVIKYTLDGNKKQELYMINGVITRNEKAAIINYGDNNVIHDEMFAVDGMT